MEKEFRSFISPTLIGAFAGLALSLSPATASDEGTIARGAKLYDSWYSVIKVEKPKKTHPSWPASNTKKKGATTWRCKSCHGWDYRGADGAYANGSYKTGIKGIRGMAGTDNATIKAVLKDDTHKLAGKMDEANFDDLATFVSAGQVDMSKYINYEAKSVKSGDAAHGKNYFNTLCIQCHGPEGKMPKDMPKPLAKLIMDNPWEVAHKILSGQPAERMPALRALDRQIIVDIMAHLATLSKER